MVVGISVYTDDRMLMLDYKLLDYPITIQFKSEVESTNTEFLPSWSPIENYLSSIEKSEFKIVYPKDLGIKYKEYNFAEVPNDPYLEQLEKY